MRIINMIIPMVLIASSCTKYKEIKAVKTGREGTPIPQLNLLLADSSKYINTKDLVAGKTTVFFYFSPTCPHCRVLTRNIINHIADFKDTRFVVLTIANYKSTKDFYERYNLKRYPNIITGIDTGFVFPSYFKTQRVPFIAIYGTNKILENVFIGSMGPTQLYNITQKEADKKIAQSPKKL